ncbi:MAG TPA: NADH-quinone oxidoreductase subunit C [Dactylosporangium sp.]|nr:NADH-quinone oxidoreductase subunit C [Dactylosporangium sp.]
MTPAEIGARLVEALGAGEVSESGGGKFARATVEVPVERWVEAITAARDGLGCDFFDWLTAVDELPGGFTIVAHLWSTADRHGVLVRTTLPREAPELPSVVAVFPGAAWHERETHEMFGITVLGHADIQPLLLPPEFEGHPLRKEFVLASRVAKPWPGAKEPGESEHAASKRAPMRPPGVPSPDEWPGGRG